MVTLQDIIVQLNPTVVTINQDGNTYTCLDKDNKTVTVDISAAETELAKQDYKNKRYYGDIGDQLDLIWHAIDADTDLKTKFAAFYNAIKAVKDANPKPS